VDTVTISPKFQVVLPRKVREALGLRPGEKVHVFAYEGRIEFIPVRDIRQMRGFLRGLDTTVPREGDRQ
jgi:AbrB family looped-hinge helix DNA binding protein